MKQSEQRTGRRPAGGVPPSFGRGEPDPAKAEDFTIRGGESFHLVLHVDVQPDAASLRTLYEAVRGTTKAAVLDGYAAAFAEMDEPEPEPDQPPAPPAGEPDGGGDG